MAKLTPGIGWSEARGSVGGVTYCRSSAGLTFRGRSNGPSRRTRQAIAQSAIISTQAAAWRELTQDQRRQWSAAADADAVAGYPSGLSGFALFCAVNTTLRQSALPTRTTPSMAAPGQILTLENPTQLGTSGTFILNASRTDFAGSRLVIRATSPAPAYLAESRNPTYRFLATLQGTPISGSFAGWNTAWWTNNAGFSGQVVTWEFRIVALGGARGPVHRRFTTLA